MVVNMREAGEGGLLVREAELVANCRVVQAFKVKSGLLEVIVR